MSAIPSQDVYLNLTTPLTVIGGGGSAVSTFDNLFVTSTLTALDIVSFNISTTYLEADNAVISSLSTLGIYLDGALLTTAGGSELLLNGIPVATTSNISSLSDWSLDPAISTVNLNSNDIIGGVKLITDNAEINQISTNNLYTANIFSPVGYIPQLNIYGNNGVIIQSDQPSSVITLFNTLAGGDNKILLSTNRTSIEASTLVDVVAGVIDLISPQIFAGTAATGATTFETGSISSFELNVNNGVSVGSGGNVTLAGLGSVVTNFIDSIDGNLELTGVTLINNLNAVGLGGGSNTLAINGLSTINGLPYIGNTSSFVTSSITAQSANFSSLVCQDISTVTLTAFSTIHAVSTISSLTLEANSIRVSSIKSQGTPTSDLTLDGSARFLNMYSQGMSNVIDRGADFGGNAFYRLTAQNGAAGEISMTAEPGISGNFGRIGLTANGGTLAGVGLGGLVEITATTPLGSLCNASSAIKLSAAGINSYAGAVPPVGSLTGYNYVYGTLGVNLTAGLPPGALPNTPGTVYFYGTNGVVTGSPLYAYEVLGYWNGVAAPSNLRITGRQVISGNSQVVVSNVDSIFFDAGYGALTGVSSINSTPYPPTFVVPSNLNITSLNATSSITADSATFSTLNNISSVNGSQYPPTFAVPENLVVSTLVAANYVSTLVLESISSIFTLGDINIQANNVTTQGVNVSMIDPGGAGVSVVGGLTSIKGSPSVTVEGDLSVSTITNLSSINGQPYNYYPGASAVSSISRAGGLVEVNSDGSITAASAAAATIQLDSLGQIALATSISTGTEQMSLAAASTIYISSGSLVQMTSELSVPAITNVSTINNSVYPPPPYVLPENLTVSSLAAFNLSTVNLNVSTINGAPYIPANSIIPYTLSGTTAGAVIVNKGTGATSSLTQNVFISTSQITFNLPAVLNATESIYYDGYSFNDFDANFNSFWGVSYYTNTVSTPTDILGSTSATANALNFPNNQQVYVPLNLIIPPTNITAGGTVTLTLFCNATSANHYLIAAPINTARIGVVSD